MTTDTDSNKVTVFEMALSLVAAYIMTQVTWLSTEKRIIMSCVYIGLVLLQTFFFIADLDKGKKETLKNITVILFAGLTVLYAFLAFLRNDWERTKEGIGATVTVIGTPHPYMLGWWLVKQFFQSFIK